VVRRPGSCIPAFRGVPEEVLLDNARALVDHQEATARTVRFLMREVVGKSTASLPGDLREARLFQWVELRIVS
jgi:hypothetical protein